MKKHLLTLAIAGLILATVGIVLGLPYLEISIIIVSVIVIFLISLIACEIREIKNMAWDIPLQE